METAMGRSTVDALSAFFQNIHSTLIWGMNSTFNHVMMMV